MKCDLMCHRKNLYVAIPQRAAFFLHTIRVATILERNTLGRNYFYLPYLSKIKYEAFIYKSVWFQTISFLARDYSVLGKGDIGKGW